MNKKSARRDFIKQSSFALGMITSAPFGLQASDKRAETKKSIEKKLTIVCVGAHPGDPEFGCGGTMAKYSDAGHRVIFLYLTKGEASDPTKSYAEMAELRSKEAAVACKILNAVPKFAGQIDGNTILDKAKNEAMSKLILEEKPDIVFTQWPVDAHPDHQVTGLTALNCWAKSKRAFHLYFYEVNTGVETMSFVPTDYVDITATHDRKKQAMFAHQTQDPINTYNNYFKPLEEFRGLECGVKQAESFVHFKSAETRSSIFGL